MKKIITLIIVVAIFGATIYFRNDIINFLITTYSKYTKEPTRLANNMYSKTESNYALVKLTDDFDLKSIKQLNDIYYTVINSGMTDFTFYCNNKYETCIDDVNYVSNNQKLLSHINNYVPVYNTFKNIETEFDNLGRINIKIIPTYTSKQIKEIDKKVNEKIKENITDDMTDEAKIKKIHDYIINNTKYDSDRTDKKIINYASDTAYGTLFEGYAICGGYADTMKIFLDKFNIPNFKVSSENHIWNAVYVNNKWMHLDLTWDDPVTSTGEDILEYDYFLISTKELLEQEKEQHIFDYEIYPELKEVEENA